MCEKAFGPVVTVVGRHASSGKDLSGSHCISASLAAILTCALPLAASPSEAHEDDLAS